MNVKLETNFWVQYFLAPELQLFVSSLENCENFLKTSTPLSKLDSSKESSNFMLKNIHVLRFHKAVKKRQPLYKFWVISSAEMI